MRGLLLIALGAWLAVPASSRAADPAEADRLVAEGVTLGEAGDYLGAIERFSAAEQAFPRPVHDCNIGLAWIGLKAPATAFFFIDRCTQRARAALPTWVAEQHAALQVSLGQSGHAQVRISSTPPGALLSVDALPGAAPRTPVTLWLPTQPTTLTGRLDGFMPAERTFETPPKTIALTLRRPVAAAPASTPSRSVASTRASRAPTEALVAVGADVPAPSSGALGWTLLGTGAITAAAGSCLLYAAHGDADDAAQAAARRDSAGLTTAKDATRFKEGLAYGAFGLAAIAVAWGSWALMADDDADIAVVPLGLGLGVRLQMP